MSSIKYLNISIRSTWILVVETTNIIKKKKAMWQYFKITVTSKKPVNNYVLGRVKWEYKLCTKWYPFIYKSINYKIEINLDKFPMLD